MNKPKDWKDYITAYDPVGSWFTATHQDYDPTPWHSGGPPGDDRFFWGNSEADVWQQVIEYNEGQDA